MMDVPMNSTFSPSPLQCVKVFVDTRTVGRKHWSTRVEDNRLARASDM